MEKRHFEQLEGVFHHNLGTYAEIGLANALIQATGLDHPRYDSSDNLAQMHQVLGSLPAEDERRAVWESEIPNIEQAAAATVALLGQHRYLEDVHGVLHTAKDYAGGAAADVRLTYADGSVERISVKTDKSGKVALAGGQTGLEQWASRLYEATPEQLADVARRHLGMALAEVRADYQDAAHLMQWTVRERLAVDGGEINDWRGARPTDEVAMHALLSNVKRDLNGADKAMVFVLERSTGKVGVDAVIESVVPDDVDLNDITFTPCRPRAGRFGTTLGIKYQGAKLFDHQVKHKRGKAPSHRFNDVTTRATRADGEPTLVDRAT